MANRIALLSLLVLTIAAGAALADGAVTGPFAATVHAVGNLTTKDGSAVTVTWDRGRITTLSSTSITLTRRDTAAVTFAIDGTTAVRNDGATYSLADLKTGQIATVVSQNGMADVIRNIRGEGAPGGAEQSAFEGPAAHAVTGTVLAQHIDGTQEQYDYNRGRISDLGNGSITIKRGDGQTVTLGYDGSTVVRERDGSIESVDDLDVGQGAMFLSQGGTLELVRCVGKPGDGGNGQAADRQARRQGAWEARRAQRRPELQAPQSARVGG